MHYLTKCVEWLENNQSGDFIISIVGNSSIEIFLESLASSQMVGTRKIVINQVKALEE
jgi:hypothetical protein